MSGMEVGAAAAAAVEAAVTPAHVVIGFSHFLFEVRRL